MQKLVLILLIFLSFQSFGQRAGYWQQRADYDIAIDFDDTQHQFSGNEQITYRNNSPDTLNTVYFHLYYNAFQPGSMMDVRSRTIEDPDNRVGDRISKLNSNEIGYQKVLSLKQNGKPLTSTVEGTLLIVDLAEAILPGTEHEFELQFEAQVPLQIRRTGRDNKEGIDYSMSQWFPKIAEYDEQGWHAYQYIGREFYSPWGDYDVRIQMDPKFTIGATGVLQNPEQIGHGYAKKNKRRSSNKKLEWHFKVDNVIDFVWAADRHYTHETKQVPNGPLVHFFYQKNENTAASWRQLIDEYTVPLFTTMSEQFGQYQYPVYSVIQGGDGGMEYPLATLITGNRKISSLFGVTAHELGHSWYQMMLASNEALYAWMDEGMASFADAEVSKIINKQSGNAHKNALTSYVKHVTSGYNEPANQHSDHFATNYAYSVAAYVKGELLLMQLRYMMGDALFHKAMIRYFNTWKFKHPKPNDFIRVMEKESGLQLHWFMRDWLNTTRTIDYGIEAVTQSISAHDLTQVDVASLGQIQIPVEITVKYKDGRPDELIYIPVNELLGKKTFTTNQKVRSLKPWAWVEPTYSVILHAAKEDIKSIEIDAQQQTADVQRDNNKWTH